MQHSRSHRRVGLTPPPRTLLSVVTLLAVVLASLLSAAPASSVEARTLGTDDYPRYLKDAAQDAIADPWNFWNRECTSFVAWRLNNDAGVPFHNYYRGVHYGDASNWRYAASQTDVRITQVPERGDVAWWAKYSSGSTPGHVAWVLSASSSSITIEEYNYVTRGGYSQRVLFPGSSAWPSAFLRFEKSAPISKTRNPSVSGTPAVGRTLTADPGDWSPSEVTFAYEWLADGEPVRGAVYRTFTPGVEQLGKRMRVRVTASKSGSSSVTATSERTTRVVKGTMRMTSRPTVTGTPRVGERLEASRGAWTPRATDASYQWLVDGVPLAEATRRVFTPRAAHLGLPVSVEVRVSAPGMMRTRATSERTVPVAPGRIVQSAPPTIVGTPQVDAQLSASAGTYSPTVRFDYQWKADGRAVRGATRRTFSPSAAQLGERITVKVVARRDGYAAVRSKAPPTDNVEKASFAETGVPTVQGLPQVDRALVADVGTWSPSGNAAYQWSVDGRAVRGATGPSFTPRPEDVASRVTVAVTMSRPGYRTATTASAASAGVEPGAFVRDGRPLVVGDPQVEERLRVTPPAWTPSGELSYQWYADDVAVPGATRAAFVPTPAEQGTRLTVRVTTQRPGYLPGSSTSEPTSGVARGVIRSLEVPRVSGDPVVGGTLEAHPGRWSVDGVGVAWQWFAGGVAIEGATSRTYSPTTDVLDQRLTVSATVSADGYHDATQASGRTTRVVLGHAAFGTGPRVVGRAVVGRTLTADPGTFTPSDAVVRYTWLRSGEPLDGVTGPRYVVRRGDVGHRLSVRVSLAAPHWTAVADRVGTGARTLAVPDPTVTPVLDGRRAVLRVAVRAPGLDGPDGRLVLTEAGERVATAQVLDGRLRLPLGRLEPGRHVFVYTYGGALQLDVQRRFALRVPSGG